MYLRAEITDNGIKCTNASSIPEMCTAITILVHKLYEQLPPDVKDGFKFCLKAAFADDVPFARTAEDCGKAAKRMNEKIAELKSIDELFDALKEIGLKDDQAE